MDFYGGYKMSVGTSRSTSASLYYYYPGSGAGGTFKIDNTELYISAGYGPVSVKYSHASATSSASTTRRTPGTSRATAASTSATASGLIGHLGYQKLKNNARVIEIGGTSPDDSITDWKIGVTYDLSGLLLGAAYVGTNRDLTGGTAALSNRNISNGTVVLSVSKTF